MKHFTVTIESGYQSIIAASSLDEAWEIARRENGINRTKGVRASTEEDIEWQSAMGGRVPDLTERSYHNYDEVE